MNDIATDDFSPVVMDLARVNALIANRMVSAHAPFIDQISAHLIQAGGKKIRPVLTLATARMFGYMGDGHLKLAATVELIHSATLLHDDVVDESSLRRGQKTANLLWGNKPSVLVGDYLFSRAFQLMVEVADLRILQVLSQAAATLSEGEILQLTTARNLAQDYQTYIEIIRSKTAVLFSAATQVGAMLAGVSAEKIEIMRRYGEYLGIAFQLIDDVLDYQGDRVRIGKDIGSDFREGKVTLPMIYAYDAANEVEKAFWRRVVVEGVVKDDDFAHAIALCQKYGAVEKTKALAFDYARQASLMIEKCQPDAVFAPMLRAIAQNAASRMR